VYIPSEFKITNLELIESFIQDNPLGIIISVGTNQAIHITHLPFLCKKEGALFVFESHIATNNEQCQFLHDKQEVTLVFQGVNGYVSSSVYTHHNVPTWNYQAVHVKGILEFFTEKELEIHLANSVSHFEKNREKPLRYRDFDREMIASYMQEIKAFKITSTSIEAAFKLSQNRNNIDFQRIIDDLAKSTKKSDNLLALEMKKFQ
jgi:transcriptional regulator